jgi:hypothetical protein
MIPYWFGSGLEILGIANSKVKCNTCKHRKVAVANNHSPSAARRARHQETDDPQWPPTATHDVEHRSIRVEFRNGPARAPFLTALALGRRTRLRTVYNSGDVHV